ncbi:MAG: hypothetical protein HY248_02410 [Fimbriimonas ginsengisoli]|uniref:Uncharacterized protein n=1 Tax=Fimbriimonas ginsengisoli TaxID=1005039 RepID=A0A931LTP1_FIMGI|nr:hypothetical protein [Fimbriimonas ginsengisoli]MBI3721380.1 hypothetical protein [Fimbriimonas ginsengisoli]
MSETYYDFGPVTQPFLPILTTGIILPLALFAQRVRPNRITLRASIVMCAWVVVSWAAGLPAGFAMAGFVSSMLMLGIGKPSHALRVAVSVIVVSCAVVLATIYPVMLGSVSIREAKLVGGAMGNVVSVPRQDLSVHALHINLPSLIVSSCHSWTTFPALRSGRMLQAVTPIGDRGVSSAVRN